MHPDRTESYFRLQIQGDRKLVFVLFKKCLAIPTFLFSFSSYSKYKFNMKNNLQNTIKI